MRDLPIATRYVPPTPTPEVLGYATRPRRPSELRLGIAAVGAVVAILSSTYLVASTLIYYASWVIERYSTCGTGRAYAVHEMGSLVWPGLAGWSGLAVSWPLRRVRPFVRTAVLIATGVWLFVWWS